MSVEYDGERDERLVGSNPSKPNAEGTQATAHRPILLLSPPTRTLGDSLCEREGALLCFFSPTFELFCAPKNFASRAIARVASLMPPYCIRYLELQTEVKPQFPDLAITETPCQANRWFLKVKSLKIATQERCSK